MKKITKARISRFFLPRSLSYQLLSRSLLILSCLLLFIGILQYALMQQFLYNNKAESIQSQIRAVPYQAWQQIKNNLGDTHITSQISSLRSFETTVAFIDLDGKYYDLSADVNYGSAPHLPAQDYNQALHQQKAQINYRIIKDSRDGNQLVIVQPVGSHGDPLGIAQVSTPVGPLQEVLVRQLTIFLFLSLGAFVVGLLTFLPILRRTLIPLSRMVETVERINAGNLDERLPSQQGQLEIERLSVSFNNMLKRLELSFDTEKEAKENMRRFVADASHELRTPLTSIHGFLEVLLRGAVTNPDQLRKALQSMYGESERLNKLVQDLIFLARLDRAPEFELKEGRLDLMMREMETQLRLLAGERAVNFDIEDDVHARFDPDRIKQVMLNLFQNAVQHTDAKDGMILVSLKQETDEITITVQDNGAGIPTEHLSRLFERFYRIDSARSRLHGGAGLGLSITKSIVEAHRGTIHYENLPEKGARFSVQLPSLSKGHQN
ncbi:MAG: integral rane sensor signal transduction histidine kinase [Bacilli bacterium]|nr:integral rane sensor signal transduction histidine kinase [Bacilli bacterium]